MAKIREKIDLVGKLETLQSLVAENHSSNGIIKKYISSFKFRNDVDTISLVAHMLREFKYKYASIDSSINQLEKIME